MIDNPIVSDATLIPIGIAITTAIGLVSLVWRVSAKTTEIVRRLDEIEHKLDERWTRADQLEWIMVLRDANPTIKFPTPPSREQRQAQHPGG